MIFQVALSASFELKMQSFKESMEMAIKESTEVIKNEVILTKLRTAEWVIIYLIRSTQVLMSASRTRRLRYDMRSRMLLLLKVFSFVGDLERCAYFLTNGPYPRCDL